MFIEPRSAVFRTSSFFFRYNSEIASSPLKNVSIIVPVDGGVMSDESNPPASWYAVSSGHGKTFAVFLRRAISA